jgi:hypothetical protein
MELSGLILLYKQKHGMICGINITIVGQKRASLALQDGQQRKGCNSWFDGSVGVDRSCHVANVSTSACLRRRLQYLWYKTEMTKYRNKLILINQ